MSEWSLVEVPVPANSETCSIANIPSTLKLSVTDSLPTDCVTIYGQSHHCNLNIPFQQNLRLFDYLYCTSYDPYFTCCQVCASTLCAVLKCIHNVSNLFTSASSAHSVTHGTHTDICTFIM